MAAVALVAAAVMAVLWIGAQSRADDAATERDAVTAERDAAIDAAIESNAELQTVQDELEAARDAVDDAAGDVGPPSTSVDPSLVDVQALEERIDELTEEIEQLEILNEILATGPTNPNESADDAESDADPTTTSVDPPETSVDAPAAPDAPPISSGDVGDQISRLFRPSVLGSGQKTCVGDVVLNELGEQRVVETIASESPGDDEEFIEAIRTAAATCNIDITAILG